MGEKRIFWALSSVGYAHLIRDLAVIDKITERSDIKIDLLVPPPIDTEKLNNKYNVLPESALVKSSGISYRNVLKDKENVFDLTEYGKEASKFYQEECNATREILKRKKYDLIVSDEAFWILAGFRAGWLEKEVPFVFMSEFVGTKSMIPSRENDEFIRTANMRLLDFCEKNVDLFVYFGSLHNIPNEPFGEGLPNQREWVSKNCYCNNAIVKIDKNKLPDKIELRKKLSLPDDKKIYLGVVSSVAKNHNAKLLSLIENCFEIIKNSKANAHFIIINTDNEAKGTKDFIEYHNFVDNLVDYMAASDFAVTQTGINKVSELSALGVKFISIPMDFHFEQEYFMGERVKSDKIGKQLLLRETTPEILHQNIMKMQENKEEVVPIKFDDGSRLAKVLMGLINKNN